MDETVTGGILKYFGHSQTMIRDRVCDAISLEPLAPGGWQNTLFPPASG